MEGKEWWKNMSPDKFIPSGQLCYQIADSGFHLNTQYRECIYPAFMFFLLKFLIFIYTDTADVLCVQNIPYDQKPKLDDIYREAK